MCSTTLITIEPDKCSGHLCIRRTVGFLVALLLCTPFAQAEDWPQFRGPAGQGCSQEKELPVRWGADSTNIRWKTPIPGQGVSSPIVSQGRVYVTTAYEGEQRNPWYTLAVGLVLGLAVVTMGVLVFWLHKQWRWLIHDAPGSWRRIGLVGLLGSLTVLAVALTTLILLRPGLFWADDVRWIGATPTLDAHLPLVENLYLRQLFVASLGSLVLVFAAVALHVRRQAPGSATDPTKAPHLLALWMSALTACSTLAMIVASVLVIARPLWFWEAGQPWRAWLVSGGLGLGTVAAAVGWLPQNRPDRLVGITLVLVLAGWLFWNTPLSEINRPINLDLRVWYVIPGCLLIASAAVVSALGLRKGWPAIPTGSRLLAVVLTAMAFVLFWWANELQPISGMLRVVVCLDARTGIVLWQTPVLASPTEKKHTLNSYATPTPATDGERIYADFGSSIAALNRDGRLLWLKTNPSYANFTRYGAGSSPVLANELLIVYRDREWAGHGDDPVAEDGGDHPSALIAYDKLTGHERWRATPSFSHDSYMTPLIWSNDGRSEVVVATWRTLAGFDLETGELRWRQAHSMDQMVPSLVVHGDCLIASGGNNSHTVVAIRPPRGEQPPETRWESTRGGTWISSPVCCTGLLFSITKAGVLFCRDVDSGKILWSRRLRGSFLASLVTGAGKVYALNENGEMFVMAATRHEQLLAENRQDEGGICAATPALADGCLFIRTGQHLICIGEAKP